MRTYNPDCWVLVKLTSPKFGAVYKILGSWSGGYLHGDSWKLSSGIEEVREFDDRYEMPQSSGSLYVVRKSGRRVSFMIGSVFETLVKDLEGTGSTIEILDIDPTTLTSEELKG